MFTAGQFRKQASENAESIKNTDIPGEIRRIRAVEGKIRPIGPSVAEKHERVTPGSELTPAKGAFAQSYGRLG